MNNRNKSWYKKQTYAQNNNLNELIDYVDDDTSEEAVPVLSQDVVDLDGIERQKAQNLPSGQGEVFTIPEEDIGNYLVDDLIEEDEQSLDEDVEEGYFDGSYIPSEKELEDVGIETVVDTGDEPANDNDEIENPELFPDFGNDFIGALEYAIGNNRVVKLSYLTLGKKKGRGGKEYLKREISDDRIPGTGVNIWRIVEPHDIFRAKNGHDILVTYDRSVRHIRAFRIENITDVEFTKKRGTEEPSYFKPGVRKIEIKGNRDKIKLPPEIKGTEAMNINIFQNLKTIGDDLEKEGLSKTAGVITATMNNLLNIKTAQYVGPQGYWIRQKRCWDNCYRHKRTASPDKSAQVVWTECWEEYNKSINNNESGWEKYAKEDSDLFKYASSKQKEWVEKENKKFASTVNKKIESGMDEGMSIYSTLGEKKNEYNDILLADADNLSKLAEKLKENGQTELSEKIANISVDLLKEAQFGGGWEGAWNKVRKFNPFSSKSRAKGLSGDIRTRLKRVMQNALQMADRFNTLIQQARESGQQSASEAAYLQQQEQDRLNKQQARQQTWNNVKNWGKEKAKQVGQVGQGMSQQLANVFQDSKSVVKESQVNPDFAVGVFYRAEKYYAGISSTHLTKAEFNFGNDSARNALENHFYLVGGYDYQLNYDIVLKPSLLVKTDFKTYSFDLSVMATLREKIWGGLSFRQSDAVVFILGYSFLKENAFKVGYAFDYIIKAQEAKQPTSHEFYLSYTLPVLGSGERRVIRTPRFRH